MALSKLTANLNTHQSQPDQPSLTSEELKQLWDEAPNAIKEYINEILTVELDKLIEVKVNKVTGKDLSTNDYTDAEKKKLSGIADEANKYIHPTTTGNKHVPSGGSAGKILRWAADGTAVWGDDYNTTYSVASQSSNGLMSAYDKAKLDGVATGANKYSHPTNSGNKHVPAGGSSGQILKWASDGTAVWGNNYGLATTSANGLMSATDKTKLNGIATGATRNVIRTGTANPSGGSNGDIYIQYF